MFARIFCVIALLAVPVLAQPPRGYFAWWDNAIVRDLNLSSEQRQQVRGIVREYRSRLVDARAATVRAEDALEAALNADTVDAAQASAAVRSLADARQQLTLAFSEMSVKLRMVLTTEQWKELQKRRAERPLRGGGRRQSRGSGSEQR